MNRLLRATLLTPTPFWRLLAIATLATLLALVFVLGQKPISIGIFQPPMDKVAHLSLFFVVSGLIWVATGARSPSLIIGCAAVVGFLDEFAQQFNPGRTVSFADWLFDLAGAILFLMVVGMVRHRDIRRHTMAAAVVSSRG